MRNNKDAIKKIFDDLDNYRDFCRQFGWVLGLLQQVETR